MNMATRSLTDVFVLMRNNAILNRRIYHDQSTDTNEIANRTYVKKQSYLPPPWIHEVEQAQFELTKLNAKISELKLLQVKNIDRPSLDDTCDEEKEIENLTHQITSILNSVHKVVQLIKSQQQIGNDQEKRLKQNILRTLALKLQEHTTHFRTCQSSYLGKIKSREQRLNFFDGSLPTSCETIRVSGKDNNCNKSTSEKIDNDFMTKTSNSSNSLCMSESTPSNINSNVLNLSHSFLSDKTKKISKEDCHIS